MKKDLIIETKHPRFNEEFFGFKDIEDYFLKIVKNNKLLNSYIFHGIKGVGKATFAYKLTRFLLNNEMKEKSFKSLNISKDKNIFKNIMNLSHPDLFVIEPEAENKKINLEQLKLLHSIVYKTTLESNYKIIIIDSLDDFTSKQSFSILLKLLEDCPKNCIFLLISNSLSKIPNTIKSRCQKIYFRPISNEILKKWFKNSELIDEKNLQTLINFCDGSLGRAINMINNSEYFKIYSTIKILISDFKNITKDKVDKFFSLFNKNVYLEDFLLIIQINIMQNIKQLLANDKNINKEYLAMYISLFFEINERKKNYKLFNLDSLQTINSIKNIFNKKIKDLNKI